MSELKRWIDDSPPDAVVRLLGAARREEAPPRVLTRTLLALGASSASAVAAASSGLGVAVKVAPSVLGIVIKWGSLGLLSGSVFVGAVTASVRLDPARGRSAPVAAVAPPAAPLTNPTPDLPRARASELPPTAALPPAPEPQAAPATPAPRQAAAPAPALEAEIELLDTARARLRAGDGSGVEGLLDDYETRFSPSRFEPEVLYLRMEASLLRNDSVEARRLAQLIVTRYPTSPGVSRAERVLSSARKTSVE